MSIGFNRLYNSCRVMTLAHHITNRGTVAEVNMVTTGSGGKRFFCYSTIMWVKAETVPEAFFSLLAAIASVSIDYLSSGTCYLSLNFVTFYTYPISPSLPPSFKMHHLWIQFYGLVHMLAFYFSFFCDTHHITSLSYPSVSLEPLFFPLT